MLITITVSQGEVFTLIVVSDQQPKTLRNSIYYDMEQRKAENTHISVAISSKLDRLSNPCGQVSAN